MAKGINEVLGIIKSDKSYNILQLKRDLEDVIEAQKVELSKKEGKEKDGKKPKVSILREIEPSEDSKFNKDDNPITQSISSSSPEVLEEKPSLNRDKVKVVAQGINNLEDLALFEMTLRVLFPDVINEEMAAFFDERAKLIQKKEVLVILNQGLHSTLDSLEAESKYDLSRVAALNFLKEYDGKQSKAEDDLTNINNLFDWCVRTIKDSFLNIDIANEQIKSIEEVRLNQQAVLEVIASTYGTGNKNFDNIFSTHFTNEAKLKSPNDFCFETILRSVLIGCMTYHPTNKKLFDFIIGTINGNQKKVGCTITYNGVKYILKPVGNAGYLKQELDAEKSYSNITIEGNKKRVIRALDDKNTERKQIIDEATAPVREVCGEKVRKAVEVEGQVAKLYKEIGEHVKAIKRRLLAVEMAQKSVDLEKIKKNLALVKGINTPLQTSKSRDDYEKSRDNLLLELVDIHEFMKAHNEKSKNLNKKIEDIKKIVPENLSESLDALEKQINTSSSESQIQRMKRELNDVKNIDFSMLQGSGEETELASQYDQMLRRIEINDNIFRLSTILTKDIPDLEEEIKGYYEKQKFSEEVKTTKLANFYDQYTNLLLEAEKLAEKVDNIDKDQRNYKNEAKNLVDKIAHEAQSFIDYIEANEVDQEDSNWGKRGADNGLSSSLKRKVRFHEVADPQLGALFDYIDSMQVYDEVLSLHNLMKQVIHGLSLNTQSDGIPLRLALEVEGQKTLIEKNYSTIEKYMTNHIANIFIAQDFDQATRQSVVNKFPWLSQNQYEEKYQNAVINKNSHIDVEAKKILEIAVYDKQKNKNIEKFKNQVHKLQNIAQKRNSREKSLKNLLAKIKDVSDYRILLTLHNNIMQEEDYKYLYDYDTSKRDTCKKSTYKKGSGTIVCGDTWHQFEQEFVSQLLNIIPEETLHDEHKKNNLFQNNPFLTQYQDKINQVIKPQRVPSSDSLSKLEKDKKESSLFPKILSTKTTVGKEEKSKSEEASVVTWSDQRVQEEILDKETYDDPKFSDSSELIFLKDVGKISRDEAERKQNLRKITRFVEDKANINPDDILELHAVIMASRKYKNLYQGSGLATWTKMRHAFFELTPCNKEWASLEDKMVIRVINLWATQEIKKSPQEINQICKENPFLQRYTNIQDLYNRAYGNVQKTKEQRNQKEAEVKSKSRLEAQNQSADSLDSSTPSLSSSSNSSSSSFKPSEVGVVLTECEENLLATLKKKADLGSGRSTYTDIPGNDFSSGHELQDETENKEEKIKEGQEFIPNAETPEERVNQILANGKENGISENKNILGNYVNKSASIENILQMHKDIMESKDHKNLYESRVGVFSPNSTINHDGGKVGCSSDWKKLENEVVIPKIAALLVEQSQSVKTKDGVKSLFSSVKSSDRNNFHFFNENEKKMLHSQAVIDSRIESVFRVYKAYDSDIQTKQFNSLVSFVTDLKYLGDERALLQFEKDIQQSEMYKNLHTSLLRQKIAVAKTQVATNGKVSHNYNGTKPKTPLQIQDDQDSTRNGSIFEEALGDAHKKGRELKAEVEHKAGTIGIGPNFQEKWNTKGWQEQQEGSGKKRNRTVTDGALDDTKQLQIRAGGYKSNMEAAMKKQKESSREETGFLAKVGIIKGEPLPHFGPGKISEGAKVEKEKGKKSRPNDWV
ncbi:hypothetical protein L3V79_03690 [Thiotrichales bacterium 19S9-12]|nr:hypothetical protein [Thiotrichales bacterium 19S9-11]MCF6811458.1 hypothetical protein [Thiotrichales bacterium 19S9-12]